MARTRVAGESGSEVRAGRLGRKRDRSIASISAVSFMPVGRNGVRPKTTPSDCPPFLASFAVP
jgi:hypothetical protein